jgi:hypothetical protein
MLAKLPECGRGQSEDLLERPAEVEWILKPQIVAYLLDKSLSTLQAFGGLSHLQLQQVLIWALAVESLEESAHIGFIHLADLGHFVQGLDPQAVVQDELSAGLICGECPRATRLLHSPRLGDFEHHQFDQCRAYARPVSAWAGPVDNQIIKDAQRNVGRSRLHDCPGGQAMFTEEAMGVPAREVNKILDHWIVRIRGNDVSDLGTIREDRARRQGDGLIPDRQCSFASGDKLDGIKWEILAVDPVAGLAMLAAAANDSERPGGMPTGVEVKSLGLEHLAREEVRHSPGNLDPMHHKSIIAMCAATFGICAITFNIVINRGRFVKSI